MNAEPVLSLHGVTRTYHRARAVEAVKDVDLTVFEGEMLAIEGPSGSGKSTLLGLMGLLDSPTSGEVVLGGEEAGSKGDRARTRMRAQFLGFVFQQFNLIGSLTAVANVESALLYRGLSSRTRRSIAEDALQQVGLADRLSHRPAELSGGEQQRVSLSRAVVTGPRLILADEPTGNLDRVSTETVLSLLTRFAADGVTVVVATHDPLVAEWADRRLTMVDGKLSEPV